MPRKVIREKKGTVDKRWKEMHSKIKDWPTESFWKCPAVQRAIAVNIKYDFTRHVKRDHPALKRLLSNFVEYPGLPCNTKAWGVRMNKSSEQYFYQLSLLYDREDPDGLDILEIGAGFGGLSRILRMTSNNFYTILDAPEMLDLARFYLRGTNTVFCDVEDREGLLRNNYDLLISNYCVSETPREYQDWVLENIFPRVYRVFMIDGDPHTDYPSRIVEAFEKHGFKYEVEPYEALSHQKQFIFWGKRG